MNRNQFRRDEIAFVEKIKRENHLFIHWLILRPDPMQVLQKTIWRVSMVLLETKRLEPLLKMRRDWRNIGKKKEKIKVRKSQR